eukprot:6184445-Pleurochrysis_carterae.AAC.3
MHEPPAPLFAACNAYVRPFLHVCLAFLHFHFETVGKLRSSLPAAAAPTASSASTASPTGQSSSLSASSTLSACCSLSRAASASRRGGSASSSSQRSTVKCERIASVHARTSGQRAVKRVPTVRLWLAAIVAGEHITRGHFWRGG